MAEAFNNYFINIPKKLHDTNDFQVKHKSDKIDKAQFTTKRSANSFFLNPVTIAEVKRILGSITPKKSFGVHQIPFSIIRTFPDPVIDILVDLINLTLLQESFPPC